MTGTKEVWGVAHKVKTSHSITMEQIKLSLNKLSKRFQEVAKEF